MIDQILNTLETFLSANGGKVTYEVFLAQIDGPARVNVVNAARSRFDFSLSLEDGRLVHYVSLRA